MLQPSLHHTWEKRPCSSHRLSKTTSEHGLNRAKQMRKKPGPHLAENLISKQGPEVSPRAGTWANSFSSPTQGLGSKTVLTQTAPWRHTECHFLEVFTVDLCLLLLKSTAKLLLMAVWAQASQREAAFKIFPIICTVRKQFYLHHWFEQSIIMLWAHLFSSELQWLLEHKHNLPSHNKVNTLQFNWMESFTQ